MTENEKLTWLAGFIDGEGHFCVTKAKNGQGRPFLRPMIAISNNNKESLDWIEETFGGKVRLGYAANRYPKHPSELWIWSITGKKAIALAILLEPYLIVKREQVKRLTRIKHDARGWMDKSTAYN